MQRAKVKAGLAVEFPKVLTVDILKRRLGFAATADPPLETFLWRIAHLLPALLDRPEASFAFLQLALYCRAESARRIQQPWLKHHGFLVDGIVQHRIQYVAVFFEHLRYWLRRFLVTQPGGTIPEVAGLSPFGYGVRDVSPRELKRNRRDLLRAIDGAGRWFERTIGMVALARNLNEPVCGHPAQHWIDGANMPAALWVPATLQLHEGNQQILPAGDEAKELISLGWPQPAYPAAGFEIRPDDSPAAPADSPAVAKTPESPPPAPAIPMALTPAASAITSLALASRTLQSGILVAHAPLPDKMLPEEKELANLLTAYKNADRRLPYPLAEIAHALQCSHETIRRRKLDIETKYPELRPVLAAIRARNSKGPSRRRISRAAAPLAFER